MSISLDRIDEPVDLSESVWVGNIPNQPGMKLKVRPRTYSAFQRANTEYLLGYGANAASALSRAEYKVKLGELMAEHILVDWKGAITQQGKDVAYSKAMARKALCSVDDRGIGDMFREAVAWASGRVADIHAGLVEDMAGN